MLKIHFNAVKGLNTKQSLVYQLTQKDEKIRRNDVINTRESGQWIVKSEREKLCEIEPIHSSKIKKVEIITKFLPFFR